MNRKIKTIFIIITSFILLGILGFIFAREIYYAPTYEVTLSEDMEKKFTNTIIAEELDTKSTQVFSRRLTIPTLSIDAKIQDVGITTKGNMSTPNNFFDVGLYKYGPFPGDVGSAVIAGHVKNGLGFDAVFGDLENIKIGDDIYVEIEKDKKVRFIVTSTATYDYDAPTKEIFEQNDGSYLKLITCSGEWVPEIRTHDKRLVVTAKLN